MSGNMKMILAVLRGIKIFAKDNSSREPQLIHQDISKVSLQPSEKDPSLTFSNESDRSQRSNAREEEMKDSNTRLAEASALVSSLSEPSALVSSLSEPSLPRKEEKESYGFFQDTMSETSW